MPQPKPQGFTSETTPTYIGVGRGNDLLSTTQLRPTLTREDLGAMVLNGKASISGMSNTHCALTDNIVALPVQNRIATLPQVLRPKLESPSLTDRCYP